MGFTSDIFGLMEDGRTVHKIILTNELGLEAHILTYGAIIQKLLVPSNIGPRVDVVHGYDTLEEYLHDTRYMNCIIAPVAGRIAGATVNLDGETYKLTNNEGNNFVHSGAVGAQKRLWDITKTEGSSVTMSVVCPDGEDGLPGNLEIFLTYTITEDSCLMLQFSATTDKLTPVNIADHMFCNLAGHESGLIDKHLISINASEVIEQTEKEFLFTGNIIPLPEEYGDLKTKFIKLGDNFDKWGVCPTFKLDTNGDLKVPAFVVKDPDSRRVMRVFTDQPIGILYMAYFWNGFKGKGGAVYNKFGGFLCHCGQYPDTVHHPNFPTYLLKPGDTYKQTTYYHFSYE